LIHQTVANKSRLSCEEKHVIESWKRLNPDHTHHLWDDADMRAFMVEVSCHWKYFFQCVTKHYSNHA
jgi:mannosyltransferase OCH1-like enzyme